jgi:hypothetical protein
MKSEASRAGEPRSAFASSARPNDGPFAGACEIFATL